MPRPVNSGDGSITPPPPPILHDALKECFTLAEKKEALATGTPPDETVLAHEYCTLDQRLAETTGYVHELIQQLCHDNRMVGVYEELRFEECEQNAVSAPSEL